MTKVILEKQNKDLRTRLENLKTKDEFREASLQEEIEILTRALSGKDKIITMLQREIASLTSAYDKIVCECTELKQERDKEQREQQRLMSIIKKNSSNSSKPPSTDGFHKVLNSREKSTRPSGGQKGHPGRRIGLPKNLDELIEKGIVEKDIIDHTNGSEAYVSRWTLDIKVKVIVTEHKFSKEEALPKGMENEVTYGDNIKAITVLLSNEGIIAEERLAVFFAELTQGAINPSDATINNFLAQFAQKLPNEIQAIKDDLQSGKVMNVDDTSLRCTQTLEYGQPNEEPVLKTAEKMTFNATLRTHSNERSTLYTVNPKKDRDGLERDGILPKYTGILSHDHESKFYNYGTGHGTCGEHLLRDLKGLLELRNCAWAGKMRSFVKEMNCHKNADLQTGKTFCDAKLLDVFDVRYDALLTEGVDALGILKENELGYTDLKAMLKRLHTYKDCYLLFLRDYIVPFTNNLSERDLRPSKTKQKVSGCFRSWSGLNVYAKTRSFISTAKKRGKNLFQALLSIFKGSPVFAT